MSKLRMINCNISASKILTCFILFLCLCLTYNLSAQSENNWASPLKRCWINQTNTSYLQAIASDNNRKQNIVFLFSPNSIISLNATNGNTIWETKLAGQIIFEPVLIEQTIFLLTKVDNGSEFLNSIDIESGFPNWKKEVPFVWGIYENPINKKFFLAMQNNSIASINKINGEFEWTTYLTEEISNISLTKDGILLSTEKNKTIIISEADGKVEEELRTGDRITYIKKNNSSKSFRTDEKGTIEFFDTLSRKIIWRRKIGSKISNVSFYKDTMFISSLDNFVYIFDQKDGSILHKRRLDGRIINKPTIQNNFYAVFAYNSLQISIFDLDKIKVVNQILLSNSELFVENILFTGRFLVIATPVNISVYSFNC